MKRAALSDESTNSAPPLCIELLATITDRSPVEEREAHDHLGREQRLDLEEAVGVDHAVDEVVHVEGDALVGRHHVGGELPRRRFAA